MEQLEQNLPKFSKQNLSKFKKNVQHTIFSELFFFGKLAMGGDWQKWNLCSRVRCLIIVEMSSAFPLWQNRKEINRNGNLRWTPLHTRSVIS